MTTMIDRCLSLRKIKDVYLFGFDYMGVWHRTFLCYSYGLSLLIKPAGIETPIIVSLKVVNSSSPKKLKYTDIENIISSARKKWKKIPSDEMQGLIDMIPLNSFIVSGDFI